MKGKSTKTITERCFSCQKQVSLPKISSVLQKMNIGQNSIYALFAQSPSIVIDAVALHENHPSVTSRMKHARNVENWVTSNGGVCHSGRNQNTTRQRKDDNPNLHSFEMGDECVDDSLMAYLEINNVNQGTAGEVIWVTPKINGHTLKMELDKGLGITLPLQKCRKCSQTHHWWTPKPF